MKTPKVAYLDREIVEQLNQRIEQHQPYAQIAAWLNEQPSVRELIAKRFDQKPINEMNISRWVDSGYKEWKAQRQTEELTRQAIAQITADNENPATILNRTILGLIIRLATLIPHVQIEQLDATTLIRHLLTLKKITQFDRYLSAQERLQEAKTNQLNQNDTQLIETLIKKRENRQYIQERLFPQLPTEPSDQLYVLGKMFGFDDKETLEFMDKSFASNGMPEDERKAKIERVEQKYQTKKS